MNVSSPPLLAVEHLETTFLMREGPLTVVRDVSFTIQKNEIVGVVGESGSGKTQLFLSIMGLLAKNGRTTGSVRFDGQKLLALSEQECNRLRGDRLSMIFQDPLTSLNPYLKISEQMVEVLIYHRQMSKSEAKKEALRMLDCVKIPEAKKRFDLYPHEFSGGMRQRVMIAMSLLCQPDLLIADEPSTALDVTVQAEILLLLKELQQSFSTSIVLITHDLGIVAGLCDRVLVMYAGEIVEESSVDSLFSQPYHPYSWALLSATPRLNEKVHELLNTIPGQPPCLRSILQGCSFQPRCPKAFAKCLDKKPLLQQINTHIRKACHLEQHL